MLDINEITDAIASHAMATGHFDQVNLTELRTSGGNRLTAAVWVERLRMLPNASGLTMASLQLVFNMRLYQSLYVVPRDVIDPLLVSAASELFDAYAGDFTLGGLVRNVDILGAHGTALDLETGYIEVDGAPWRVCDIQIPLIVNDVYEMEP